MAERRPLVYIDGVYYEIPAGDMLPSSIIPVTGGGISASDALALAVAL